MAVTSDTRAAESGPDPASAELAPGFDELKAAHAELIAKYLAVLGEASTFGEHSIRQTTEAAPPKSEWAAWQRVLVNRLAQAHIKRRLVVLARTYLQLAQAPLCEDYRDWLTTANESCAQLESSLSSWKLPGLFALISPLIAVGTLLAKTPYRAAKPVFGQVGLVFIISAVLLGVAYRDSHREKRRLFLWGYRARPAEREESEPTRNIYRAEDRLFGLLSRHKPREWSLLGAVALAWAAWTVLGLLAFFILGNYPWKFSAIAAGLALSPSLIIFLVLWRKPAWVATRRPPHGQWR